MNSTKKIIGLLFLSFILSNNSLQAQQEGFLGEVKMFAGNFVPRGWALCQGQLMSISQNQALFAVIGTIYGGDGRTTFALPDYRGRIPRGTGNGPGLQPAIIGQKGGTEFKVLSLLEMPQHTHALSLSGLNGSVSIPVNTGAGNEDESNPGAGVLANTGAENFSSEITAGAAYGGQALPVAISGQGTVGVTGGSQSFDNRQPFTTINYIICVSGVFPSRN
ncbi:tail fiber protein [uncultured Tenacibaculum sp.]|uniref:phage tail protein n=1 Tax=uncultured Tenacibaculum sp. TaxID=174713 RepID=UPI00262A10E1|nr:tail fiber protein [uncultured Tenacibaculum sp.]